MEKLHKLKTRVRVVAATRSLGLLLMSQPELLNMVYQLATLNSKLSTVHHQLSIKLTIAMVVGTMAFGTT